MENMAFIAIFYCDNKIYNNQYYILETCLQHPDNGCAAQQELQLSIPL